MKILIFPVFIIVLSSCASKEKEESNANPATLWMDNFYVEQGMPVREIKNKKDFFYKHCEIESRRAFTSRVEYSCNDNIFSE